jgi:uncharacterized membrane protein YcaP (DUF421 family)
MDAVLRALAVYAFLLLLFRLSGKRTLAQITTFDLIVLLIVSEATQQALLGDDFSITNACIVILTLLAADRSLDMVATFSSSFDRIVNGSAVLLIEDGDLQERRLRRLRITPDDILEQARTSQGIERLDQIKHAVLERNGAISVVPRPQ